MNNSIKIQTSYFAVYKSKSNAISIAYNPPSWYRGETYPTLHPPKVFVLELKARPHSPEAQYRFKKHYNEYILNKCNVQKIVNDLNGKVLLCWERAGEFCHRRLVAEWIETKTGIIVPEYKHVKKETEYECQATLF